MAPCDDEAGFTSYEVEDALLDVTLPEVEALLEQVSKGGLYKKTDWSVSEKGRVWSTASWARRTFAAATRRIASVIFCVLPTVAMRSRSSPPLPI